MKKFFAVLFIALLASMPIAFAQSLNIQQFAGRDNVRNVAQPTDTLVIKALVSIPGDDTITNDQVRLTTSSGITYLFDSCGQQGATATCTLRYDLVGEGGTDSYAISLFDDDNKEVTSDVEVLTNDFIDPALTSFSVDPSVLGTGPTTVTYAAEDYAFSPGDTSACAGVGKINLYEGGTSGTPTATIPGGADCTFSGTFQYAAHNSGNINFCAQAVDRLNRKSLPMCTNLSVDKSPPQFTGFRVTTKDGFAVHAIPPDGILSDVAVTLNEQSLDVNSVRADFNTLTQDGQHGDTSPQEIGSGTSREVIFHDIPVNKVSPCEFTVKAADVFGNIASQKFTCAIVQDTSPPQALGATTGYTSADGTVLLGIQGVLTVRFSEASMERANAYLDATPLGLGSNRKAETCVQSGSEWDCQWHLPGSVPAGRYAVTIQSNTADDLGNQLGTAASYSIDFDRDPPRIISGPSFQAFHPAVDYGTQVVNGDTIELSYNVSGGTSAVGNFSQIGGGQTAGLCDSELCTFSAQIQQSGGYTAKLPLTFFDDAGNFVTAVYNLTVYSVLNETDPHWWGNPVVDCSPSVVDRSSAALINHQVYCHIKLHSYDPKADIVATSIVPGECTGNLQSSIADVSLVNNGFLSKDPYMRVLLATREYPEQTLNITCPIYILTKIGNGFTQFPEKENVTMRVSFGTSAMGSLGAGLDDKINNAVASADGLSKWLDTAVKFLDFGNKVCTLRNLLVDVMGAFEVVHAVLTAVATAAPLAEGVRAAWCGTKSSYEGTFGGIDKMLAPFCGFLNCKGIAGGLLGDFNYGGLTAGQGAAGESGQLPAIIDPKQSFVWSALTLCVPGLIYNVDKYRQIQCRYATCLLRDVKKNGVPVSVCDDEKSYLTCNYFWGQAFNAIPFANIVQYGINLVKEVLANPFAALTLAISVVCPATCPSGTLNIGCAFAKVFEVVGRVIGDVQSIKGPGFFKLGQGPCNDLKQAKSEAAAPAAGAA